jgi:hypothetical protein
MSTSGVGTAVDWLQFAEFYWQLGDPEEGRVWYDRYLEWARAHPVEASNRFLTMFSDHAAELFEGER